MRFCVSNQQVKHLCANSRVSILLTVIGNYNISNLDRFVFEDDLHSTDKPTVMAKNQVCRWIIIPAIPKFPAALIKEKQELF